MSNYRRLISYIYAYEGGIKGKNVGFAKLEIRNGQCKIQVNVRNVYIGSQDTGVYLLAGKEEILVGKIFIRNGAGEFRTMVQVNNVAGLGQNMDQCYGLTVHNMADSWQSYTTIWEDAVAQAAQIALEEATSEQIESREMGQMPESRITSVRPEYEKKNPKNSIADAIEAEIEAQDRQERQKKLAAELEEEKRNVQELEAMEIKPMEVTPIGGESAGRTGTAPIDNANAEEEEGENAGTANAGTANAGAINAGTANAGAISAGTANAGAISAGMADAGAANAGAGNVGTANAETVNAGTRDGETESEMNKPVSAGKQPETDNTEAESKNTAAESRKAAPRRSHIGRQEPVRPERTNLFGLPGWWGQSQQSQVRPMQQPLQGPQPRQKEQSQQDDQFRKEEPLQNFQYGQEGQPQPRFQTGQEVPLQGARTGQEEPVRQETGPGQGEPGGQMTQIEHHIEEEPKIETIWQEFFKRYPKIQAFDYNGGCEILTIKPQDIGLLPREIWGYGNNSFLLHGYYNHRYLIFARLNNPKGEARYLLGVPGHYYSNEKYMAAMFGFPNFVLSKIQPAGDGRFGYWYTDVRIG